MRSGSTDAERARLRGALRAALRAGGLLGTARAVRRMTRAWQARGRNAPFYRAGAPDGLPLPPARLVDLVAGTPELEWFLAGGALAASSIKEALQEQGADVAQLKAILDFGCGCGRVLRHWSGLPSKVHGCDYNRAAIRWCRRNLSFAQLAVNRLEPPLPYAPASFDLVYALSVFTHLPGTLQRPWVEELFRVLRPGGFLLVSVHGEASAPGLSASDAERFRAGELVVVRGQDAGTNLCAAYHPEVALRALVASRFDVLAHHLEGARGNPPQDLVVLRRL